ncbi:5024_t:CDS:1, partial [Funneliformis geosporum]
YWIFYVATGVGLLVIRYRDRVRNLNNENDQEINREGNEAILFKVPIILTVIFIFSGLYILIFSFVVNVQCPNSLPPNSDECRNYLRAQSVHKMSPFFISYGFLFIALIFWYHYWWKTTKQLMKQIEI